MHANQIERIILCMKVAKMNLPIMMVFVLLFSVLLSACHDQDKSQLETTTLESQIETTVTGTQAAAEINQSLFMNGGHVLLLPNSMQEYETALNQGSTAFWELNQVDMTWSEAEFSVRLVASITSHAWYETDDKNTDVYLVRIGQWIGCCKLDSTGLQALTDDLASERLILENMFFNGLQFELSSKDYFILQIFDDLYSVDSKGTVNMISKRSVGGYDYNTADKKGIGDLYGWLWTSDFACSPADNRVFYLTSRESKFYTIWMIDIDEGTESLYSDLLADRLYGIGNRYLIARIIQEVQGDPPGALISTTDNQQVIPITGSDWEEGRWDALDGNLYRVTNEGTEIWSPDKRLIVDDGSEVNVLQIHDNVIWLSGKILMRIDIETQTCQLARFSGLRTISGYRSFLEQMKENQLSYTEAEAQGILIKIIE